MIRLLLLESLRLAGTDAPYDGGASGGTLSGNDDVGGLFSRNIASSHRHASVVKSRSLFVKDDGPVQTGNGGGGGSTLSPLPRLLLSLPPPRMENEAAAAELDAVAKRENGAAAAETMDRTLEKHSVDRRNKE
jgi:hypothetical protein